jgi:hypothetical protein
MEDLDIVEAKIFNENHDQLDVKSKPVEELTDKPTNQVLNAFQASDSDESLVSYLASIPKQYIDGLFGKSGLVLA